MSVSRRAFVRSVTTGAGGYSAVSIAARGHEEWLAERWQAGQQASQPAAAPPRQERGDGIRLSSNENPLGPGPSALKAIEKAFVYSGRYPMNAKPSMLDFRKLIAKKNKLKDETYIALGAGSGEILDNAVRAFTTSTKGLVAGSPTFEAPVGLAKELKVPVAQVLLDEGGKLDCEKMIAAATGAGLVFFCNPNNPTATVHSEKTVTDLVTRIRKASPETIILLDEAYHDYVTDPSYATGIPLIAEHPTVIVARTLSKAHGMAGLRLGYVAGHPDVLKRLTPWMMPYNGNALVVGAAVASIEDESHISRERKRNTEALKYTTAFFKTANFKMTDSQANFIWVDLGRPAAEFREACRKQGIFVGRPFPPLDKTHCRISIGTMDEMKKAVGVFRSVLGLSTTTVSRG
jgi:histidinol-phosphate aminotransferase